MTLEGGKGSKAPDPNPGMIRSAESSERVGMRALDLQEEYMDWSKQFYEDLKPTIQAAYETETSIAKANQDRANEYADYERNTYRPIEQALVKQAAEYNTEAKREELARAGAADVSQAFGVARDQQRRQLGAQGLRPDSGRFAALNQQLNLQEALSRAGVQNKARTDAENLGFARAMDVTGLGRNLATNASTAYGVALQGSGQSTNTAMTGGNFMNSAYGQGSNMLGQATNAYGTAGNIYGQEFNARMQGYNAQKQAQGDMFGAIGGVAGRIGAAYMTGGTSLALGGMADGGRVLGLRRYADGGPHEGAGPVSGPGGPVDDKIPAMLSNGEYVLPADTVKKVGVGRLDKLVKETHTPAAVQRKRKALKGKK
jgi:hypothetical protein